MRLILPYVQEALFKDAGEGNWQGRVQVIGEGRECVPFAADYTRYMVEFERARWLNGNCSFEDSLFKCSDGSYFLPKIDHRIISVWTHVDGGMRDVKHLCADDPDLQVFQSENFFNGLVQAVYRYFFSYPNASQYFFQGGTRLRDLIAKSISARQDDEVELSWLYQVTQPFHGFELQKR